MNNLTMGEITVLKQKINALVMYVYLLYYDFRLKHDTRFMLKELHAALVEELRGKNA